MSIYTPDWKPHKELEKEFDEYLTARGYLVTDKLTYHNALPAEIVNILSRRNSPTALYIRTRADRLAVHKELPIEFQWEAKTAGNSKYTNMAVEVMPLLYHLNAYKLAGVNCIYAYQNQYNDTNVGFWIEELPRFASINIPMRWSSGIVQFFMQMFRQHWPDTPINLTDRSAGSGDPYALISRDAISQLSHWKTLIDSLEQKVA